MNSQDDTGNELGASGKEHYDSRQNSKRRKWAGLSWVDWMVVLAVLLILIAVIPITLDRGLNRGGRRVTCLNNIRQVILASHNYASAREVFPSGSKLLDDSNGESFLVSLLSFIDQDNLYREFQEELKEADAFSSLKKLSSNRIDELLCPAANESSDHANAWKDDKGFASHYFASMGPNSDPDNVGFQFSNTNQVKPGNPAIGLQGVFSPRSIKPTDPTSRANFGKGFGFSDAIDGSTSTIAVLESSLGGNALLRRGWAFGHAQAADGLGVEHVFSGNSLGPKPNSKIGSEFWNDQPFGSKHEGGFNVAMADGSSLFVSDLVDMAVLRAAMSMNDGVTNDNLDSYEGLTVSSNR